MDSMGSNQVWTLVDPSKGVKSVGCKWVYKCKLGADGEVTASRPGSWRKDILNDLGSTLRRPIRQWPWPTGGFHYCPSTESKLPKDFEETYLPEELKVCCLQKSIYGLKQVSRSWNTRFDEVIRGYDFTKNDYDPCIYKKISRSSVAYLVLYVDDILLIGNDVKMLGDIKA
ncbi:UNVERIFIED_CONTAM: hypothetical protein Slati_3091300 [Sesamum latifolium]|uniref:Reverse transcriptase Ty1/copia-type domain-containing protein n=1 Tax=Sesamum latifolium TaxID=2727402 RepID=A0AAW2UTY2_9LAMI